MADNFYPDKPFVSDDVEPINILETRWQYFSPFSAHEVELDSVVYKTAEHAYQALRMVPAARDAIMATASPMDAWRAAQVAKQAGQADESIDKYELMERIFRAKLAQHPDVEQVLRDSGERELRKNYDLDNDWGTGADGLGQNNMGKLWMKLRNELE